MRPVLAAAAVLLISGPALATDMHLAVQGHLTTVGGGPVADGDYPMAFKLYDKPSGGQPLWSEFHLAVAVRGGAFALALGDADPKKPMTDLLFDGGRRYLGVTVGGDAELPRRPLYALPSAARAWFADKAGALACSGCIGGNQVALAAIRAKHVGFNYALSDTKGGPAKEAVHAKYADEAIHAKNADEAVHAKSAGEAVHAKSAGEAVHAKNADKAINADKAALAQQALSADTAKQADTAKNADSATHAKAADTAKNADSATHAKAADAATVALRAKALECTGCVASSHLGKDLAVRGSLAVGKGAHGPALITNARQLERVRLWTAAKVPYACDAAEVGGIYFDTHRRAIMVCDGTAWAPASRAPVVACTAPNTDLTKSSYQHYGSGNCSPHYGDQTWLSRNDPYKYAQFGWHDSCGKTGPNPFATIVFPAPTIVQSFRVLLHTNPPKKCRFQASNATTNGLDGTWTTLYGPFDFPSGKEGQWDQRRSFNNATPYLAYRLHCPGSPAFALYEWEFFCGT